MPGVKPTLVGSKNDLKPTKSRLLSRIPSSPPPSPHPPPELIPKRGELKRPGRANIPDAQGALLIFEPPRCRLRASRRLAIPEAQCSSKRYPPPSDTASTPDSASG